MSGISALATPQAASSTDDQSSTTTTKKKKKKAKTDTAASGDQAAATDSFGNPGEEVEKKQKSRIADAATASDTTKKSRRSARRPHVRIPQLPPPIARLRPAIPDPRRAANKEESRYSSQRSRLPLPQVGMLSTRRGPGKRTRKSKKAATDSGAAPGRQNRTGSCSNHRPRRRRGQSGLLRTRWRRLKRLRRRAQSATTRAASDAQIASAKSSGMVWVNTDSGVYHKGGRWYGKTKTGKFMSEADAKAAGFKASEKD